MNKLNKTGRDYRHANKNRVAAFNDKMKALGYKKINVFVDDQFKNVLNELKINKNLSQHEAMAEILDGYLKYHNNVSHNDNVNINNIDDDLNDESFESTESINHLQNQINNIVNNIDEINKKLNELSMVSSSTTNAINTAIQPTDIDLTDMPSKSDKAAYRAWLVGVITEIKRDNPDLNYTQIAKRLSAAGIETIKHGNTDWTNPMVKNLCKK